jgi:hypothetical protein
MRPLGRVLLTCRRHPNCHRGAEFPSNNKSREMQRRDCNRIRVSCVAGVSVVYIYAMRSTLNDTPVGDTDNAFDIVYYFIFWEWGVTECLVAIALRDFLYLPQILYMGCNGKLRANFGQEFHIHKRKLSISTYVRKHLICELELK